jgi:hypothetical protein
MNDQSKQPSLDHGKSAEPSERDPYRAADEFANPTRQVDASDSAEAPAAEQTFPHESDWTWTSARKLSRPASSTRPDIGSAT